MPGPQRKPRTLKIIAGTDIKKRRDEHPIPEFDKLTWLPDAPKYLKGPGLELWNKLGPQLIRCGVLQVVDTYALEQLCYAWQKFRERAEEGYEVTASENNALKALWQEFGLTPAARRRVTASEGEGEPKNKFANHGRRPGQPASTGTGTNHPRT